MKNIIQIEIAELEKLIGVSSALAESQDNYLQSPIVQKFLKLIKDNKSPARASKCANKERK